MGECIKNKVVTSQKKEEKRTDSGWDTTCAQGLFEHLDVHKDRLMRLGQYK